MSLNINGERLLAEALADAMERDLANVPEQEQLKKQHRFSKKFVRRMKRIEAEADAPGRAKAGENVPDKAENPVGSSKGRRTDFAALGRKAGRFGAAAAALVCIAGLTAFLGVMGRIGTSEGYDTDMAADEKAAGANQETADVPADDADISSENGGDAGAGDRADAPADAPADFEERADFAGEPAVPGWQERLLEESRKADELILWYLKDVYDGGSFVLESELADSKKTNDPAARTVRASQIYEVYYEESADAWVRVYHTDRSMSECERDVIWGEEYNMRELNMTKPGTYRVVRQVNSYRQVLELTLETAEFDECTDGLVSGKGIGER
ncbi:hypothetical protein AALB53_04340 [Lachnospiraceae bacterium 47-T17]